MPETLDFQPPPISNNRLRPLAGLEKPSLCGPSIGMIRL